MTDDYHIYVHIPFCERKCSYCNFVSIAGNQSSIAPYFSALGHEITRTAPLLEQKTIRTIYFGGGTPSCVPAPRITGVINLLRSLFAICDDAEITAECNPHSLNAYWIDTLAEAGVNRFSLGIQSLNDTELGNLGRLHDAQQAERSISLLQKIPGATISVDLMYGIPGQSTQSWDDTLRIAAEKWHPFHVSLYALSIEPGTPFARWKQAGTKSWDWPGDDTMMDWYWHAADILGQSGYTRYEISNYAVPGYESRHNLCYWDTSADYIGFGASAHSFCRLGNDRKRRFHNIRNIPKYMERADSGGHYRMFSRRLSHRAAIGEELILGLRRAAGVTIRSEHRKLFNTVIERQVEDGLLYYIAPDTIALTRRGIEIANTVMADYI
jgi:oxygen-independent coproporphyrinogen-3 oxidase